MKESEGIILKPLYIQNKGKRATKTLTLFATFRKNLPIIRAYRELSQSDLGTLLNIRPKRISDFEIGRMPPKMEEVFKIAKALNCSVGELMDKKIKLTFED